MPILSIIIPAYNAERTILETLASVQKQTFSDFELIVINDGSSDQTLELLHSVADERLRIFSYENGGVAVARNRGISHATGEFIAFMDADDLWTPDKLELQLAALQQHAIAGVAYSWTRFINEQGKPISACDPIFFEDNVYAKLLVGDFIYSGSNTMIRRQAIESVGEFDPACAGCDDWDYWLRLAARWPFVVVPKHQILYRRSSSSASSNVEKMKKSALISLEKAYQMAPPELQHLRNQSLISFHNYCADLHLRSSTNIRGFNQAGRHLLMSICIEPKLILNKRFHRYIKWYIKNILLIPFFSNNSSLSH